MEERRFLADPRGLLHRVGYNHHRIIAAQFVDKFLDLCGRNRVKRRTWLIHQQHLGLGSYGAGNAQALLLPPPTAPCPVGQAGP